MVRYDEVELPYTQGRRIADRYRLDDISREQLAIEIDAAIKNTTTSR